MKRIILINILAAVAFLFIFSCNEDEKPNINNLMPAPSDVVLAIESSSKITVSWKDNSDTEAGFIVQRIEGLYYTTFKNITKLAQNITTFSDSTVSPNGIYNYKIIAVNDKGEMSESLETVNITPTPMAKPKLEVTQITEKFYAKMDSTSAEKTFTVQCSNLSNDIIITSPSNFLISLGGNKGYTKSLTIPMSYNSGISQRINVKYKPLAPGEQTESITVVAGDLNRSVGVKGSTN